MYLHVSVILFMGGWYPSMPCRFPGPHPGGSLRGLARGGFLDHTKGEVDGSGLGGLQAHTWRGIPACTEANTPPADSYCCRQYASYWNAFLYFIVLHLHRVTLLEFKH